ncbi:putative phage tail protein [Caloranaerobacter azorensis]|uniref:DUF2313 domain-containing protein n=1 Tax=Caloranaerobacter azorensis TaxID=116090 RepID=A0A6P1YAA0_9FIRM|nr:putative phage tail protein [Caloranaerobacter azorensis]QIB26111.1 DUF2313 domain-containing protein [Caloranaerobacter azorensis]
MNNYEEIKTFLPDFYNDILEMQLYFHSLGSQLDKAEESNTKVLFNNFIYRADEDTIERLEKYLYLPIDKKKPLEDRRRLVASFFVGFGKMSASKIKEIVYQFTNAIPDVKFEDSTIIVEIERGYTESLYLVDVATILSRKLPAHLGFTLSVNITVNTTVKVKSHVYQFDYKLCDELICGTYPRPAYLGEVDKKIVNVSAKEEISLFDYRLCGTYPTNATVGDVNIALSEMNADSKNYPFDYKLAGTTPDVSTLGDINNIQSSTDEATKTVAFSYILCGTKRCGE